MSSPRMMTVAHLVTRQHTRRSAHARRKPAPPATAKSQYQGRRPTGLLNEGFRYRDLETGIFLTRDPAGFIDGPNLYAYVLQNPWAKFDSEGLFAERFLPV